MSTTKGPKPWPIYPTRQLVLDGNIVDEVDKRIAGICALYDIDQQDPSWERLLLVTLLARHAVSFAIRRGKGKVVDNAFLIEVIDGLKDLHEERSGNRPSTAAVVQEIVDTPEATNPFHGMEATRMMRIYSGSVEYINTVYDDLDSGATRFAEIFEGYVALGKAPESFAALLFKVIKARYD